MDNFSCPRYWGNVTKCETYDQQVSYGLGYQSSLQSESYGSTYNGSDSAFIAESIPFAPSPFFQGVNSPDYSPPLMTCDGYRHSQDLTVPISDPQAFEAGPYSIASPSPTDFTDPGTQIYMENCKMHNN